MPVALMFVTLAILTMLSIVGLRLLHTGYSQKSIPEIALAVFFLLGAAGTFGFELVAREFLADSPEWQAGFRAASSLSARVPAAAIALFTWKVFRPTERWAALLFMLITAVQLALGAHQLWSDQPRQIGSPTYWIAIGSVMAALGWTVADSFNYYRASVRRLALGLTRPIVTNRFLLWAIFSGTGLTVVIARVATSMLFDQDAPYTPARTAVAVLQNLVGLTCITALALTFYPPAFYKRWVENHSSGSAAVS